MKTSAPGNRSPQPQKKSRRRKIRQKKLRKRKPTKNLSWKKNGAWIRIANSLTQSIRSTIRGLQRWIADLTEKKQILLDALEQAKEPTLSNLLVDYFNLRNEQRSEWSSKAQIKCTARDLAEVMQAVDYLKAHALNTVEDLNAAIKELNQTAAPIRKQLKQNENRMRAIAQIKDAAAVHAELKPIHDTFLKKNFKLTKDAYAAQHKEELDTFNKAVRTLMKLNGSTTVDFSALDAEFSALQSGSAELRTKLETLQPDMEPFNVIYQTAEDGLGDTVKPRLIEAGADLDRVLVIDDSDVQLTLSDERIEKAIIENNARLVIIDPIQAYLGADVDMNRANEVRPIFMRLGQVAQRTGCAILLIGHLNKAAGMQSLQRGLGSIDIAAAVRSVMFIGKLKHDPTMRILTHEKSSLAPPGASLAFSLGDEGGFRWVGEYDITADEMLSGIEPQRETKTRQAKDLICALLAGGKQVLSEDIDKAALERGIPGRTVRDAKRELGDALKSKIVEGRKKVFWME